MSLLTIILIILDVIIWSVLLLMGFFVIYRRLCVNTAHWQRIRIWEFTQGKSSLGFELLYIEFEKVTFQEHMNCLALWKDPIKLYGPCTQAMWKQTYG